MIANIIFCKVFKVNHWKYWNDFNAENFFQSRLDWWL